MNVDANVSLRHSSLPVYIHTLCVYVRSVCICMYLTKIDWMLMQMSLRHGSLLVYIHTMCVYVSSVCIWIHWLYVDADVSWQYACTYVYSVCICTVCVYMNTLTVCWCRCLSTAFKPSCVYTYTVCICTQYVYMHVSDQRWLYVDADVCTAFKPSLDVRRRDVRCDVYSNVTCAVYATWGVTSTQREAWRLPNVRRDVYPTWRDWWSLLELSRGVLFSSESNRLQDFLWDPAAELNVVCQLGWRSLCQK